MFRSSILPFIALLISAFPCVAREKAEKVAIIKSDDVRGVTEKWNRFFKISRDKQVKVSAGIICDSLQADTKGYFDWLRKLDASGEVEFWNHGWDHKRWTTDSGTSLKEFNGTGYAHQKKHLKDAQEIMKKVLGEAPIAFGAPYNATDANTAKVLDEDTGMRLIFVNQAKGSSKKVLAPMSLRGEADGTGKPDFEKFKKELASSDVTFAAIQFHPNSFQDRHFGEYAKILDLLIAEGWTFRLPSEVVALAEKK